MRSLITYYILGLGTWLLLGSCNKPDVDPTQGNTNRPRFDITFLRPTPGDTLTYAAAVWVQVRVDVTTEPLHGVRVWLYPLAAPGDLIIDHEGHVHEESYFYNTVRDLSDYPTGSQFRLVVEACSEDGCTDAKPMEATMEFALE